MTVPAVGDLFGRAAPPPQFALQMANDAECRDTIQALAATAHSAFSGR